MSQSVAFDRAADYYDATRGFPAGAEPHIVGCIQAAGGLTANSRVIEVGVGTGRIALPMAQTVSAIYGLDLSRPMMKRLLQKRQAEPVYLAQGDATRLPFPDRAFDAAVVVHVFHLIPGWREVLAELERVLRPGGRLVHCWSEADDVFRPMWEAWSAVIGEDEDVGIQWRQNPNFLEEAGWQPVGEVASYRYSFETSATEFMERLRGRIWSRTWRLSDDLFAQGVAAMEAALPQHFPDPDTPLIHATTFIARGYRPPEQS